MYEYDPERLHALQWEPMELTFCMVSGIPVIEDLIVLQQSSKKWASFWDGGPHRVTSSNIYQIKAKSLTN